MKPSEHCTIPRVVFALLTIHTWYAGMFERCSVDAFVVASTHSVGLLVISLFGALGFISLLDSLANDLFSGYALFPLLLKYRHLTLMAIAILNASELYVASFYAVPWGLIVYNLVSCTCIACVAFQDVFYRFPDKYNA